MAARHRERATELPERRTCVRVKRVGTRALTTGPRTTPTLGPTGPHPVASDHPTTVPLATVNPTRPLPGRMQTVEADDGRRYLLVKRSGQSSLVRDPATGTERYVANESLRTVDDVGPLETAASGVPNAVRRLLTAVHDDHSLGVVCLLVDRGAIDVRTLLAETTLCESELHGLLAELRAAGLLAETTVAGERAYEATALAEEALDRLRVD